MALTKVTKLDMNKLKRIWIYLKIIPLTKIPYFILSKFINTRLTGYNKYLELFKGKNGLEIGGPSDCFCSNNILPIYSVINNLDGANFGTYTIWEGELQDGEAFRYDNKTKNGSQYIREAVNLNNIQSGKYDFVVSCNCLEHIANPILAIKEWLRVLKHDGLLLMMLPNKMLNFDHKRNITTLNHLISDLNNNTAENDLTHLDEILELHELSLDPEAGTFEDFKDRGMKNFENRALHHHVFDMKLLKEISGYLNVQVLLENTTLNDLYILVRKA